MREEGNIFHIDKVIDRIPRFVTSGENLYGVSEELIRGKLFISEKNDKILRLARGEGRERVTDFISKSEQLFDWGLKSNHAFLESSRFRDQLEPAAYSREFLFELLNYFGETLRHHKSKSNLHIRPNDALIRLRGQIEEAIQRGIEESQLVFLKEFLLSALHNSGHPSFRNRTPWISTSTGPNRISVAHRFGRGFGNRKNFIILDYWVAISEEGDSFYRTRKIIKELKSLGIEWYRDRLNEVMVKYAFFPQNLVGYYDFVDGEISQYCVNPFYLQEWSRNPEFQVGDQLSIPQNHVRFPAENPYNMIYVKGDSGMSVFDKR